MLHVPDRKQSPHLILSPARRAALADLVRHFRHEAELSQEGLAEAAHLGRAQVQRIERAQANPTLATMYSLAEALSVPIHDLLPD